MDESNSPVLSRNVRFLLWREGLSSERWIKSLRVRLGPKWSTRDVAEILRGNPATSEQIDELARTFGVTEEDLAMADLLRELGVNVLLENLRYLIESLGHGGKKQLADHLTVDPSTVSRWLAGNSRLRPNRSNLRDLTAYFGLAGTIDLTQEPVFLSLEPASTHAKKQWLRERINAMSTDEIRELFPALRRLLEER